MTVAFSAALQDNMGADAKGGAPYVAAAVRLENVPIRQTEDCATTVEEGLTRSRASVRARSGSMKRAARTKEADMMNGRK